MLTQHSDQPAKKRRKNMFKLTTLSARKHYLSLSLSPLSFCLSLSALCPLIPFSSYDFHLFIYRCSNQFHLFLILCFDSHYFSLYTFSSFILCVLSQRAPRAFFFSSLVSFLSFYYYSYISFRFLFGFISIHPSIVDRRRR